MSFDSPRSAKSPDIDFDLYLVAKDGGEQYAHVLQRRADGQIYVHYRNSDKRMDEWVSEDTLRPVHGDDYLSPNPGRNPERKRKRETLLHRDWTPSGSRSPSEQREAASSLQAGGITEEEYDIQHHKQITARRNFDKVNFGHWQIKTWYFSPYPLTESEAEDTVPSQVAASNQTLKIPGVNRATLRSHGRTSDLLAGGLNRSHLSGERSILWVCERCFKYMAEGSSWELHSKRCSRRHPPGRKVYQRGAHTIWEVDGAQDKLYCQNLSLFGKLFIDVKTLFFDCDNFLFYILTDADSQRDHVLGFFSKEKISYDDYNLACIIVLPPYQRKGYGMLMIEFSYELSRRSGRIGTPERPLSDLGLRSYLTYWVSTLIRFFRKLLSVLPPDISHITSISRMSDTTFSMQSPATESEDGVSRLRKKRVKGWEGEMPDSGVLMTPPSVIRDPLNNLRNIETLSNADGSATSHVVIKCTLADIAKATHLRIEDAAFALNECGLLVHRRHDPKVSEEVIVITREMVDAVATERGVKNMCMDFGHVLL